MNQEQKATHVNISPRHNIMREFIEQRLSPILSHASVISDISPNFFDDRQETYRTSSSVSDLGLQDLQIGERLTKIHGSSESKSNLPNGKKFPPSSKKLCGPDSKHANHGINENSADKLPEVKVTIKSKHHQEGLYQMDNIMEASTSDLDEKITMHQSDEKYVVPKMMLDSGLVSKNLSNLKRRRRNSVSSESIHGESNTYQDYKKTVYPKSESTIRSIHDSCTTCFLFQSMDAKKRKDIYDSMYSRPVRAGEIICKQGDESSRFFVIETGKYQARTRLSKKEKEQVFEYNERGVFGEYALMYNTGQNATVTCVESGLLWVLDKQIFMRGLFLGRRRRHSLYEDFVSKLTFLNELPYELKKRIPDCLQTRIYQKDEWIIQQGDKEARGFYVIESGKVVVTQFVKGVEREIRRLGSKDYFGEMALVNDSRRTANVKVLSDRCILVRMDKAWFFQLLGTLIKTTFLTSIQTYRQALATDKVAPGMKANLALWDLYSDESEESDSDGGIFMI